MSRAQIVRLLLRRWVQNPVVSLLCLAVLMASACMLPRAKGSIVGGWMSAAVSAATTPPTVPAPGTTRIRVTRRGLLNSDFYYVLWDGDQALVVGSNSPRWDELRDTITQGRLPCVQVESVFDRVDRGVWLPTLRTETWTLQLRPLLRDNADNAVFTPELLERSRVEFARSTGATSIELTTTGVLRASRILWRNAALNAATLAALLFLIYSLGWARALYGKGRRARLLKRSICPACRYSMAGVPSAGSGVCCPECGAVWPIPGLGESPLPDAQPIPAAINP